MKKHFATYDSPHTNFHFQHSQTPHPASANFQFHTHSDTYELYHFVSGDITYLIEGQSYTMNKNDTLIINTRELHKPLFHSTEKSYERIIIHFKPEYLLPFQASNYNLLHYFEKRALGKYNKIAGKDIIANNIHTYFTHISEAINRNQPEKDVLIQTYFIQLLIALNRIFIDNKILLEHAFEYDSKVSSIIEYINQNLEQPITLNELSHYFYISKYYLCHVFKNNTGLTVMDYITHKRIMKAKQLLLTEMQLTEIAHAVGFSDYSTFYRAFKKVTGQSPRTFSHEQSLLH